MSKSATRTLNVLLTGDATALKASFLSAAKSGTAAKAGLAAVAVGAGLAAKALYDIGAEFDAAYDKIRVDTGKTGKELGRLKKDFKNVVSSVPADFGDAAEAIAGLSRRLGVSGAPLRSLSKQILELSRITGTDIEENVKTVTRAFGDWQIETKDQTATLDLFFRSAQMSGAPVAELADLVVKFGAPLRQFGFELGEATAMFASFEKAGVNIQTMVPGLKFALKTFLTEGKDPAEALAAAFEGIETGAIPASQALELFGQRAGADMVEAVEQGRFHLSAFQEQIESGDDTIRKAGKSTMDAEENFKLLGNKLKVLVEPAATAVFNVFGKLSGALAKVNFKRLLRDLGLTKETFGEVGRAISAVARVLGPVLRDVLRGAAQMFRGFLRAVKGVAQIISGVLTGDFGKAWDGVKNLFSGGAQFALGALRGITAPLRGILRGIGDVMSDLFGAAWDKVEAIFQRGKNAVVGVINAIIDVINIIPGVPDIAHVGEGDEGAGRRRSDNRGRTRKQRGGFIAGGVPGRDSVPALLERDEYVLNKKAVKAAGGPAVLDALNFGMAPRFAVGGAVLSKGAGAVTGLLSKGAGALIDKLPKPDIPEPFTGLGPWLISRVTDWIKGRTKRFGGLTLAPHLTGRGSKVVRVGKWLQSLGYQVGEHSSFGGVAPVHSPGSLHYLDRAIDVNADGRPGGEAKWLDRIFPKLAAMNPTELLWRVAGHFDHLHLGFAEGGLVKGRVSFFNGPSSTTASGLPVSRPGLALNLNPGTDSGWDNPTTRQWMELAGAGHPVYGRTTIAGHTANLPIIDLGPSGFTGRAIDVTEAGVRKLGLDPSSFPTDSIGTVSILGGGKGKTGKRSGPRARKGSTGRGGGTEGPGGRRRKGEGSPRATISLPGMKAGEVPKVLRGLGKGITSLFTGPGMDREERFAASELALVMAGDTGGPEDDWAVLQFQRGASLARRRAIQKELARINNRLGGRLTNKQRAKLLAKRNRFTEELGTVQGRIVAAREGLAGESAAGEEGEETPAQTAIREATERQTEAAEALAQAIQQQAAELKAHEKEMKRMTDFAESATATSSATAWRALADIMSGQLGPMSFKRAQTAGAGSVGSF